MPVELVNRTSEADISRAHTDFVANASHELRTPLASIIGYMETLEDEGAKLPTRHRPPKFYATVLREARRLQSLVDDLMSLSRSKRKNTITRANGWSCPGWSRQAARDGAGPERLERLDLILPQGAMPVRGDHKQLEQLVRNLVDNALKYGASDAPVTVST